MHKTKAYRKNWIACHRKVKKFCSDSFNLIEDDSVIDTQWEQLPANHSVCLSLTSQYGICSESKHTGDGQEHGDAQHSEIGTVGQFLQYLDPDVGGITSSDFCQKLGVNNCECTALEFTACSSNNDKLAASTNGASSNSREHGNESDWFAVDCAEVDMSDSDTENEDENMKMADIHDDITQWYCKHRVTQSALSDLLKILNSHGCQVPLVASTLLNTPRTVEVQQKSGGEYKYFGIAELLQCRLLRVSDDAWKDLTELELQVNIDGLPLFKSSNISVWPILCAVSNIHPMRPFTVALYCGSKKPSNLEFMHDFIAEMKQLMTVGFIMNGKHLSVKLNCVICDAPAKALVKGIIQFNGRYGCDMCVQKGKYDGRMLFLEGHAPRRTDESFRNQSNKQHHKERSPFCDLPIDMVDDFPIDYMHQVNLGVTKRLILGWTSGPLSSRISSVQVQSINRKLLNMKKFLPSDFVRKPRSLDTIRLWKASEFRTFLLYTGPFVLKDILNKDVYLHFMSLSCGVSILMNDILTFEHKDYANELMHYFVDEAVKLYGEKFVTYNVHSLTHLSDVAARFGGLHKCSAYPFESYLGTLKRLVHNGKNPLVQIAKRLHEIERSSLPNDYVRTKFTKTVEVRITEPDNCYIMNNGDYCLCHKLLHHASVALCEVFPNKVSLYTKPCDSRLLGVYKVLTKDSVMRQVPSKSLVKKAVYIPIDNRHAAVLPLLHEI